MLFRMIVTIRNLVNFLPDSQSASMNPPIKPKLKPIPPAPVPEAPQPAMRAAAVIKLIAAELEDGDAESLNHLATLGGLGLLAELAHAGEHLAGISRTIVSDGAAKAVDPRDRVDPRKRFIPR